MENLMHLMETCRTYRRFAQKPVPQEVVEDIVRGLRYSSTSRNGQPIRLVIADQPEDVRTVNSMVKWAGALPPELGTPKADEIPTLFVAVVDETNGGAEHVVDAGLALSNMTLAAWNHGVGSCIMRAIDFAGLSEFFGLTENQKLYAVVAFGYPTHKSTLVEVPADGKLAYYLDDNKDYCVPRRSEAELARKLR